MKENIIVNKTFDFAVKIINFCDFLNDRKQFIISKQLLKSGTLIGAKVYGSQAAETREDFIQTLKLAAKEANETLYWLTLCQKLDQCKIPPDSLNDLQQIQAILGRIISTSRRTS